MIFTTTTSTNSTNEDDGMEIVQEIPVYLNQRLDSNFYLLQYPYRELSKPYDLDLNIPTKVELRKEIKMFQIEYDMPDFKNRVNEIKLDKLKLTNNPHNEKANYGF